MSRFVASDVEINEPFSINDLRIEVDEYDMKSDKYSMLSRWVLPFITTSLAFTHNQPHAVPFPSWARSSVSATSARDIYVFSFSSSFHFGEKRFNKLAL